MRARSLTAALVLLLAPSAAADVIPSADLRWFSPPTAEKSALYAEPTVSPKAGDWNTAAWVSYAYRSIVLEDTRGNEVSVPLEHQLALDYTGAIGIGRSLALDFSLPTILHQEGDSTTLADPLPRTAIGDAAVGVKANVVRPGSLGGLGFALQGKMSLPTGAGSPYLTEGSVGGELRILSELRLLIADVSASLGARFREEREFAGATFGQLVPWGLGLTVRPQAFGWDSAGRWLWNIEAFGAVGVTPELAHSDQSSAGIGISQRYTIGEVSGLLGVVLPLAQAVGMPAVQGVLSVGWAPRFYDEDDDGVEDDRDECPELEEDHDDFEDTDGCPELDNDSDGLGDTEDVCPSKQEDSDGFEDADGCPERDNDKDGVLDATDECPGAAQGVTPDPGRTGCPALDTDDDELLDSEDRCPTESEDRDGYEDEDGCPERDNDKDGIADLDDRCAETPGERYDRAEYYGCPNPDDDGDTFLHTEDRCPTLAEDFDGDGDDDGCPDDDSARRPQGRTQPLAALPLAAVEVDAKSGARRVHLQRSFEFETGDRVGLTKPSYALVRAVAALLNQHKNVMALVSVRPLTEGALDLELAFERASALVAALRSLTLRNKAAETVPWTPLPEKPARGAPRGGRRGPREDVEIRLEPSSASVR